MKMVANCISKPPPHGRVKRLNQFGVPARFLVLAGMNLFMHISEIAVDWPVLSSQCNRFHT